MTPRESAPCRTSARFSTASLRRVIWIAAYVAILLMGSLLVAVRSEPTVLVGSSYLLFNTAFAALAVIRVWVVDCFRREPHATHSHLDRTLEWIERVRPKRAVLTHMSHGMDYATLLAELPSGVEPAYDGMVIEL